MFDIETIISKYLTLWCKFHFGMLISHTMYAWTQWCPLKWLELVPNRFKNVVNTKLSRIFRPSLYENGYYLSRLQMLFLMEKKNILATQEGHHSAPFCNIDWIKVSTTVPLYPHSQYNLINQNVHDFQKDLTDSVSRWVPFLYQKYTGHPSDPQKFTTTSNRLSKIDALHR